VSCHARGVDTGNRCHVHNRGWKCQKKGREYEAVNFNAKLNLAIVLVNILQHHKVPCQAQSLTGTETNLSRGLLAATPCY